MVYVVAYDLAEPHDTSENYAAVIETIQAFKTCARIEQSVWLVESTVDRGDLRDTIFASMQKGDRLIVAGLNGTWATSGMSDNILSWLKNRTFVPE